VPDVAASGEHRLQRPARSIGRKTTVQRARSAHTLIAAFSAGCVLTAALSIAARAQSRPTRPARWVGAQLRDGRVMVTIADAGGTPRVVVTERDPKRAGYSIAITDIALDRRRDVIYIGTCCEPGSGQLRRVELGASNPVLAPDDQGFMVDAAGDTSTVARTDTVGTLAFRRSPESQQDVLAQAGVSDVAVDATSGVQVIGLVQTARLQAVVPTVPRREPAVLVVRWTGDRWSDVRHRLTADTTYCAVVALAGGSIGLLAGQLDSANPIGCAGDRLDVINSATGELRAGAVTFPGKVRHLSVDDTATFLIFTTLDGAVRWQTLAGESGTLAPRGFAAADW
jgi:hypothetical protein